MIKKTNKSVSEQGSVFFYILLGVVLFAALAFTISRGMRSQSTSNLTKRQMEIAASEILSMSQDISRSLDRLRSGGASESDLCFSHANISSSNNTAYSSVAGCSEDTNKLYHPDGGNLSFTAIPAEWLDVAHASDQGYGEWMFSNENSVAGFGSGALNLASSTELVAHINYLKQDLCEAINEELGITAIPSNAGAFDSTAPMAGSFAASGQINAAALSGKKAGCFQHTSGGSSYIFYTVLLERD